MYVCSGTKIIAEYPAGSAAGAPKIEHIYGGGQTPVAQIAGGVTAYYRPINSRRVPAVYLRSAFL